jgi:hypothetical protein
MKREGEGGGVFIGGVLGEGARVFRGGLEIYGGGGVRAQAGLVGREEAEADRRAPLSAAGRRHGAYRFGAQVSGSWAEIRPGPIRFPLPFLPFFKPFFLYNK